MNSKSAVNHQGPASKRQRRVSRILQGQATSDGDGVRLTRIIGSSQLDMLDPFLLLDAFESDRPDDYIGGFPTHPHRGFETVTYLLAGRMRHADSAGNAGVIEAGGVQWMRAGSGILHSEMPEQQDGLLFGFQLWVNLPAAAKMSAPAYQELPAEAIPLEQHDGISTRVITGTTRLGTTGPVTGVLTEPLYLDVSLAPGALFLQPLPDSHNAFVYVIKGELEALDSDSAKPLSIPAKHLAVLGGTGDIALRAHQHSQALVIAARRLNEPVARGGPFVMNTREQVMQAFRDHSHGALVAPGEGQS